MDLSTYKSKAPTVNTIGAYFKSQGLKVGTENVRAAKMSLTDSFSNFDGTPRPASQLPEWTDPTIQLAVTFASLEGHGVHTHRFNLQGFRRWNELTEEAQKDDAYVQVGDYACTVEDNDEIARELDETRSATAIGMLDQLFSALSLPIGSSVYAKDGKTDDGKPDPKKSLEYAISNGTPMTITLRYDEEYQNWEIVSFGRVAVTEPAKEMQKFS